jgi:AAHS family 4-hydroxybenzoate transporter-like MFS transporter
MATKNIVNVSDIIDKQKITWTTVLVCMLCFAGQLADGYDLGVVGLTAPGIIKEFHLTHQQMAPAFSAAIIGMLFGSIGEGYLGDKYGRKLGIIVALLTFGLGSLMSGWISGIDSLIVARFITGVGLGGMLPNVTAMMVEYAPVKRRATLTTLSFMGLSFGGMLPGWVSYCLNGESWRSLYLVGTLIPVLLVPLFIFLMPESLKYMVVTGRSKAKLARIVRKVSRDESITADDTFIINESGKAGGLPQLFEGRMRLATPFLWIIFMSIMFVNFYVNSWLNLGLRSIGFDAAAAAATNSFYYIGGACGGLAIGIALDTLGPVALVITSLIGAATAVVMSAIGADHTVIRLLVFLYGFSILGSQLGYSTLAGLLYPTAHRSKGAGFAQGIGRIGGFIGPLVVGSLLAAQFEFHTIFSLAAIPLLLCAIATLCCIRAWCGRMTGYRLGQIRQMDGKAPRHA